MKLPVGSTRSIAIFGWPLSYTHSPSMHNAAIQAAGIDAVYLALPTPTAAKFRQLVRGLQQSPQFIGANVTNPFKVEALRTVQRLSPAAKAIGAVNTLVRRGAAWEGHNTDAAGFLAALRRSKVPLKNTTVLLLGAGGAARALAWACGQAGVRSVTVLSRRAAPGRACAQLAGKRGRWAMLSPAVLTQLSAEADLVVNSLPGALLGQRFGACLVRRKAWAIDISYTPTETAFCKAAKKQGWQTQNGLNMLIEQGFLAFELWFKKNPSRAVVQATLREV